MLRRAVRHLRVFPANRPDPLILFALHQSPLRMDWNGIFRDYRHDPKRQPILRPREQRAAGNQRQNAKSSGRRHQAKAAGNAASIGG